jgi:Zn-dependent protease
MSSVPPPYGPPPPPPPPPEEPRGYQPFDSYYSPPEPTKAPEEPKGYQPFDSYYRPQPTRPPQNARRGGFLGGLLAVLAAIWAYGKYALLFLTKFGVAKTLLTLLISFGAYAIFGGPWFAAGLVLMILVHEMGHVVEIRRQGMAASAPLFIPFVGAAIFQRQHPTDALKQAQIGIAGPLAGTVGATVAFVLYGSTHFWPLLLAAYLGFFINLFNLIPVAMLDGGWIMAVVSKWFQVFGLAVLLVSVFFLGLNPILLIIVLLGLPALFDRFRNDRLPYYQAVPVPARLAMGAAWLFLVIYLGFAAFQTHELLAGLVG